MASHYECEHVKQAKTAAKCDPVAVYQPRLSSYPCNKSVRDKLHEVLASLSGDLWSKYLSSLLQCLDYPQQATHLGFVM